MRWGRYHAVIAAFDSSRIALMATLTVRNLDDEVVRRLRIRAAEHGRSAEAEHRALLREALIEAEQPPTRQQAIERLAEFRLRTAGRGPASASALLKESRAARMKALTRTDAAAGEAG